MNMNRTAIAPRGARARRWRAVAVAPVLAIVVSLVAGSAAEAKGPPPWAGPKPQPVPTPTVTMPPDAGPFPFMSEPLDLASFGYVEEEFFIEGTARSFVPDAPLAGITDGRWNASPTGPTAPYTTRLLIRRPVNPGTFNGVVLVDWMNVTGGFGIDYGFSGLTAELMAEGYAYVAVDAQAVGVNFLRDIWPLGDGRYASLTHPGDSYSFDIFSQAAMAVLKPANPGPKPLGPLTGKARNLLATGASQSGARLITYINAVHPTAGVYAGFLPTVSNNSAPLSQSPLPEVPVPGGAARRIRTDSDTPVLWVNSETEFIGSARALHQQPDSDSFRLWELTSSSHGDRQTFEGGPTSQGLLGRFTKSGLPAGVPQCNPPVNDLNRDVGTQAALAALRQWVVRGELPTGAPRAELSIPTDPTLPATIVRDPFTGIALGGLRLPDVDVPTRTLWGVLPPGGSPSCSLFGAVDPWNGDVDPHDGVESLDLTPTPEPTLSALYGDEATYVQAVTDSANGLVSQGFLLPRDAQAIIDRASTVEIP